LATGTLLRTGLAARRLYRLSSHSANSTAEEGSRRSTTQGPSTRANGSCTSSSSGSAGRSGSYTSTDPPGCTSANTTGTNEPEGSTASEGS
jgi:hypothetical protein